MFDIIALHITDADLVNLAKANRATFALCEDFANRRLNFLSRWNCEQNQVIDIKIHTDEPLEDGKIDEIKIFAIDRQFAYIRVCYRTWERFYIFDYRTKQVRGKLPDELIHEKSGIAANDNVIFIHCTYRNDGNKIHAICKETLRVMDTVTVSNVISIWCWESRPNRLYITITKCDTSVAEYHLIKDNNGRSKLIKVDQWPYPYQETFLFKIELAGFLYGSNDNDVIAWNSNMMSLDDI